MKQKIIAIVGPTAAGKSDLAVWLAQKINSEVISADSRQVYKGMDIGSGKVTKKEMAGVRHHMLDVASPRARYSVDRYKRDAGEALRSIFSRGKVSIIVGGTGQYIDTLIFDKQLPEVPPNAQLRKKLEKLSTEKLFAMLQKLDPQRASGIDRHNPRRLIRAIEIACALGSVPPSTTLRASPYDVLWIGLKPSDAVLKKNIHNRLIKRLKIGMVEEVKKLRKSLSWKRLESFGLEYRYIAQYLQDKITKNETTAKIETESWRYAKRQMRWFKRNKEIKWFAPKDERKILVATRKFLS